MGTHRAEIKPKLSGTQAQRRRWIRKKVFHFPGSPALFFLYKYIVRFGFLDGIPGLIYCGFQGIQFFHIKAKIYEAKLGESIAASVPGFPRAENRELAAAKD
jgi:hypothetical protein